MSELKDLSVSNILSCLALVEEFIPRQEKMPHYIPSENFNPRDILSLQDEAKRMMTFVGLQEYTPIVTLEKMEVNHAGSINLNADKEVFIDIDRELLKRKKAKNVILGVLAHEICHKLLFLHGLYMTENIKNEICTDLATLYVGFGELTLSGCKEVDTWKTEQRNPDGSKTITKHTVTYSTGYLTPESYEWAYILVAHSYGETNIERGEYDAKSELSSLSDFKSYTDEDVKNQFKEESWKLTEDTKIIGHLRLLLDQLQKELVPAYKQLDNRYKRIILGKGGVANHPIATQYAMTCPANKLNDVPEPAGLRKIRDEVKSLVKDLSGLNHETPNNQIRCPFCGRQSAQSSISLGVSIRKCKCGHIFCWDSRQRDVNSGNEETENIKNNHVKFKDRLKKLFRGNHE